MALKTGEAITLLLLSTLAILGVIGIIPWISVLSFSAWQWDLILSCLALVTNGLLCSMQIVVIFRLGELKSDHINHFDMEKIMRRIVVPEQTSQARIAVPQLLPFSLLVMNLFPHPIIRPADLLNSLARYQRSLAASISAGEERQQATHSAGSVHP